MIGTNSWWRHAHTLGRKNSMYVRRIVFKEKLPGMNVLRGSAAWQWPY